MNTVADYDFTGKRALIRVDFNVPLNDALEVTDNTRIMAALPTINHILESGGSVVLMSHLGRPKSGPSKEFSLANLVDPLSNLLGRNVQFSRDCIGTEAFEKSAALKAGDVLMLENLRFYKDETNGDIGFAQQLAKHGDVYVNDAFGTAHRAHASTAIIAECFEDRLCGYLLEAEVTNAQKVLDSSKPPFTAIIGGAKVSSKIEVITNLLDRLDHLIIGGGMAYTFLKAQGGQVGSSLVEDDFLETANSILIEAKTKGVDVHLPVDSIVATAFSNDADRRVCDSNKIEPNWMGLDIGPEAIKHYKGILSKSQTILWNGPAGVFEFDNFSEGTKALGFAIAEATKNGAYSLVGGGDSVAAAKQFGVADSVSYISTGGGALLEFLEGKTLPGVAALMD
ncbi:MAG: phosphoglycerate kinase [Salibacteraceae bacterium]